MTIADYFLFAFPGIFVILNPLGAASTFLSLTEGRTPDQQRNIAKRACLTSFFILLVFMLLGHLIFALFHITIGAFRIAGGFLLYTVGWQMLQAYPVRLKQTNEEMEEGMHKEDIAIVPLAIPLLAGPGAITTVLVLISEAKHFWQVGMLIGCMLVALIATYFILIHSIRLMGFLKVTGARIMNRLLGLILVVVAVQFVINGVKDVVPEIVRLMK